MPPASPDPLLNFFVVLSEPAAGTILQRVRVAADVQRDLSVKFLEMAAEWGGDELQRKPYAPTFHPNGKQVTQIRNFAVPKVYTDALTSAQDIPAFTFPIPASHSLRAVLAVETRQPAGESRFLFQACDQRQVLGRRFVLFQDNSTFRRLDGRGLTITDSLAAVIQGGELLFKSYFQAKRFLPLDHLYTEASDEQVTALFAHPKLKLPDGTDVSALLPHLTPTARRKVAAVLESGVLNDAAVTPDKIKSYAEKYRGLELKLRTGGGQRRIELPTTPKHLVEFIRCLDEEFYTSELTQRPCETNSYRRLEDGETK